MKGSPQSQDGNGVAMIQVSSTKQNIKDVSDLETCMDYFELPEVVVKIWIFKPICPKWHAAEKNLANV